MMETKNNSATNGIAKTPEIVTPDGPCYSLASPSPVLAENTGSMSITALFPTLNCSTNVPYQFLPEPMRAAAIEMCNNTGFDMALVLHALFTAVSMACQDLILMDRGFGDPLLCFLFLLCSLGTGGGKTNAFNVFMKVFEDFDAEMLKRHEEEMVAFLRSEKQLKFDIETNERLYRRHIKKMYDADGAEVEAIKDLCARIRQEIADLQTKLEKLSKPQLKKILYRNTSIRSLIQGLCEDWPSAGLISNESGDMLMERKEADMAMLNRLYDGQRVDHIGRTKRESFSGSYLRCTISRGVQPEIFENVLCKKGDVAKGIGFLPRTLFTCPEILYGERMMVNRPAATTIWIDKFNARVRDLLLFAHTDFENRKGRWTVLKFSPAAQKRWEEDHDEKERGTAEGGKYANIREFISRYSEHVARIAALFHFFENGVLVAHAHENDEFLRHCEIQEHTVEQAIKICEWYLLQYQRMFDPVAKMEEIAMYVLRQLKSRVAANAQVSESGFYKLLNSRLMIKERNLREVCHKFNLRNDSDRFNLALDWLDENNLIYRMRSQLGGSRKHTAMVELRDFPRPLYISSERKTMAEMCTESDNRLAHY
jgi:hypothetical protein